MNNFLKWLQHLISDPETLKVGFSVLASVLAALVTILAKFGAEWSSRKKNVSIAATQKEAQAAAGNPTEVVRILSQAVGQITAHLQTPELSTSPRRTTPLPGTAASQVARARIVFRLAEAQVSRDTQTRRARISAWASNLLSIAQYVIGGVLASSFIQESLTPKWVGGLGVLVLIASLLRQQFHPELDAATARKTVAQITGLIRSSEDQLAILDAKTASGQDHSDGMAKLMMDVTQALNAIEQPSEQVPSKAGS